VNALLKVAELHSGYGDVPVLRDIGLTIGVDEIVCVVGANGAGKTTLLRTIAGLLKPSAGIVAFDGQRIDRRPAEDVVKRGLVMVPEGGRLFPFMTVLENLELGAFNPRARPKMAKSLEEAFAQFPLLGDRRNQLAGSLSGGERQMCAVARAMMAQPKLLMLDEPSLGLSPLMVERMFELIMALVKTKSIAVLLVEQNIKDALEISGRGYVLEQGRITKTGAGRVLLVDPEVQHAYLGL
jgi:branched-chain amino acid transport system ATP-binding protein